MDELSTEEKKEHPFAGKMTVVTGAASGIGAAISNEFSRQGSFTVNLDRSYLNKAFFDFAQSKNNFGVEVTDASNLSLVASQFARSGKKIDFLVLSAGITQPHIGNLEEQDAQLLRRVNVEGTEKSFEAFSDHLSDDATVVFVSSDRITMGEDKDLPVYTETKKAIAQYAKDKVETHPKQRILILLPGPVRTPLFLHAKDEATVQRIEERVGIMEPEELSHTLIHEVLPDMVAYPSGSMIRMYKGRTEIVDIEL